MPTGSDINDIQTLINYTDNGAGNYGDPTRDRGYLRWSTTDPAPGAASHDGAGWETTAAAGGFVSYYVSDATHKYGSEYLTLLPSQCSYGSNGALANPEDNYKRVVFAFKINDNWGDCQDNDFDTKSTMVNGWTTGWRWNDTNVDVVPDGPPTAIAVASATTQSAQASFSSEGSTDDGGIVRYSWDFDVDGTLDSTLPCPVHTFLSGGLHSYRLSVTDARGQSDSTTGTVFVSPAVRVLTPLGDVSTVPTLTWEYRSSGEQVAYEIQVAESSTGPVEVVSGPVIGRSFAASLPVPPGGWLTGREYVVRMRAGSTEAFGNGIMWSSWTEWGGFTLTHQPIQAETVSNRDWNPTLVFVTGWNNTQSEYDDDSFAGLNSDAEDDGGFGNAVIPLFEKDFNIVKVPSQNDGKRTQAAHPERCMWNKGGVVRNGRAILGYLRSNPRVSEDYLEGDTTYHVKPYIFVTFSKGGLDVRSFLDGACRGRGALPYRSMCQGVLQIAAPNYGSKWAEAEWWRRVATTYKGDQERARRADPALYDLRPLNWDPSLTNFNSLYTNGDWGWDGWGAGRIDYFRVAGNARKISGAWANGDGVVSTNSAIGPSSLSGWWGGARVWNYGVHGSSANIKTFTAIQGMSHRTSLLCDGYYNSKDAVESQNRSTYLAAYRKLIGDMTGTYVSLSAYAPEPASSAPATDTVSDSYGADGADLQLVSRIRTQGEDETVTATFVASKPMVLEGLPEESSVCVTNEQGEHLTVERSMTWQDGIDEFQGSAIVGVEETGTYTIELATPESASPLLLEAGGPALTLSVPSLVDSARSSVVTMAVTTEEAAVSGWNFRAEVDGVTLPVVDDGVYPDRCASDGVATLELPALGAGEHTIEAVAESRDTGVTRAAVEVLRSLDTNGVQIAGSTSTSLEMQEGLAVAREVTIPLRNATSETQTVQVECDLTAQVGGEPITGSVSATIPPDVSTICKISVPAEQLWLLGEGTALVERIRVLASDDASMGAVPGALAVPYADLATGLSFANSVSGLESRRCIAEASNGGGAVDGHAFDITGAAVFNGNEIEAVQYSADGGRTWYDAVAQDGAWGSAEEPFSIKMSIGEPGRYIIDIRPMTNGRLWEHGTEVRVEVGAS